jgi:hypothetical protein
MKLFEAFQSALQLIEVPRDMEVAACPCLAIFEAQNPGELARTIKKEESKIINVWQAAAPVTPQSFITPVKLFRFSIIHNDLQMVVSGACGLCPECASMYYYHDEEAPEIKKAAPVVEAYLPCTPDGDCCDFVDIKTPQRDCACPCHLP